MDKKDLPFDYIPSAKDAEWFINYWSNENRFSAPVNVMFKLCQEHPQNDNFEEALLKCATINAFSSTNVYDLYSMAIHIVESHIDQKLKNGDLSVVKSISQVFIGGKPRNFYSFATKYCHYHNPQKFPIYDSYVAKVLCSFPNDFRIIKEKELRTYETFVNTLTEFNDHYGLDLSFVDLDKYLWCLGRWYLNPYEPTPKYYHREAQNPFPDHNYRSLFWHGEMMFKTTHQSVGLWKEEGMNWLEYANEQVKNLAARLTPEQFGVVAYISALFGKWCPYDDQSWLINY